MSRLEDRVTKNVTFEKARLIFWFFEGDTITINYYLVRKILLE